MNIKKNILIVFFNYFYYINSCQSAVLNPHGYVAMEQRSLILISFFMMLIIVIPVILMTLFFIWKYRSVNIHGIYTPDWNKSYLIETFIWVVPICIICCLSVLSWKSTHRLEPSKPMISVIKPINIDVISLDWKWLFIYPDYKIATINEIVFPVNTPINLRITSNTVMNSFFVPDLGSQIYAMAGMISKLNLLANQSGHYKGFSSNYSGNGFSNMKFSVISSSNKQYFNQWILKIKHVPYTLKTIKMFNYLANSHNKFNTQYFSDVDCDLLNKIVKQYKN
ncbi:ubiquinol oxidase subunit II [Buchnera aphidicola (Formosaphis micheliae)]|uniref:ubiquinol oxidase subunit II n=1 Tax=Buchnera aphidicola TaxID=9 RepID=UPI0031B84C43